MCLSFMIFSVIHWFMFNSVNPVISHHSPVTPVADIVIPKIVKVKLSRISTDDKWKRFYDTSLRKIQERVTAKLFASLRHETLTVFFTFGQLAEKKNEGRKSSFMNSCNSLPPSYPPSLLLHM